MSHPGDRRPAVTPSGAGRTALRRECLDAAIFDLDGVVTQTAAVHAAAWKQAFDAYREERRSRGLPDFRPFDLDVDYPHLVDGRPRYEGAAAFLASRGISIPHGNPDDPPDRETVCGLGNRKDRYFQQKVRREGVQVFESTTAFIRVLRAAGLRLGVFSASRNARAVLRAAGALDLFDEAIDGVDAAALGLPGKPDPAVLLELTRRLGAAAARTAVFEDAVAGVQAGRAGGFGLVVGVRRRGPPGLLLQHGADVEVADLADVALDP